MDRGRVEAHKARMLAEVREHELAERLERAEKVIAEALAHVRNEWYQGDDGAVDGAEVDRILSAYGKGAGR